MSEDMPLSEDAKRIDAICESMKDMRGMSWEQMVSACQAMHDLCVYQVCVGCLDPRRRVNVSWEWEDGDE